MKPQRTAEEIMADLKRLDVYELKAAVSFIWGFGGKDFEQMLLGWDQYHELHVDDAGLVSVRTITPPAIPNG